MPSIFELGVGVGDWVKFRQERHGTREEFHQAMLHGDGRLEEVDFVKQIVGIDGNDVYLHPWDQRLSVFTRIQNTETGEITGIPFYINPITEKRTFAPLLENERLVLIMEGRWNGFQKADPPTEESNSQ